MSTAREPAAFPEIPGYRIEAVLGRGSAGVVYRAVQLAVERKVALKILHPEVAARSKSVRRLQREARTTARLAHPGIVTAIDMGQSGGLWWYAMELVDGPSLAEKLKRDGPLSERDAVKLFIPLCEALEHAVDAGVVHRDIKPGNILVDSGQRARIVDLGLALAEDDPTLTAQGGTLGTPHYISPEQARNPTAADVRSDIWSLGATLYHCLCGRPPFAGKSVAEILSGVLYAPVPDPQEFAPELSSNLALVLRKCLTRDPARRYQHPRELREDLERIRERRAVSVRRSSLDPLLGERDRKRRRLLWASAGVVVVAVAALAYLRPWETPEQAPAQPEVVAPFVPLDELERTAALQGAKAAPLLERLDTLAPALPAAHAQRAARLSSSLHARLDDELVAAGSRLESELDRLWIRQRDFAGALDWLDRRFEAEERERLGLSARQWSDFSRRFELTEKRKRVDDDRKLALGVLQQRLARHYADVVAGARAKRLLDEGRWSAARTALAISGVELVRESAAGTSGFPAGDVEAVLAALEAEVVRPAVSALEDRWRTEDRRRAAELERSRAALVEDVELGRVGDVAAVVDGRYQTLLRDGNVRADELLTDVSDEARRSRDALVAELEPVQARVRLAVAESLFSDSLRDLDVRWKARRFRAIAEQFEGLAANPALAPVRDRATLVATQARILDGVLRRAAATLERLSGTGEVIELRVGTLAFRGRVEEASAALERGFRFRPVDAPASVVPSLLALSELDSGKGTLVPRAALEALAGVAPGGSADSRLECALLRWHLGDRAEAAESELQTPSRAEWLPVLAELQGWLRGADEARRSEERARVERARITLGKLRTAALGGAADLVVQAQWIDELLASSLDLDFVAAESEWLRQRRATLSAEIQLGERALLERAFGPTELQIGETGLARMRWDLGLDYNGPFQRGDWGSDTDGWIAPRPATRLAVADERNWPTLYLQPPIRLGEALELTVSIEQPASSGQPRLFSISIAGVHVVLLGPANIGQKGRWKLGSGSPEAYAQLLADLLDRGKGTEFEPLLKGERYQIRVELKQGRGDVSVWINDKLLGRDTPLRPDPSTFSDKSLVLRSLEPVRVLEVSLSARVR
ncbi:MAG: serine/threonine-protein kinase [Planctomycetota bacterium]|nr:serine/threonine-protein kinase [Planctomycetota bacterium]